MDDTPAPQREFLIKFDMDKVRNPHANRRPVGRPVTPDLMDIKDGRRANDFPWMVDQIRTDPTDSLTDDEMIFRLQISRADFYRYKKGQAPVPTPTLDALKKLFGSRDRKSLSVVNKGYYRKVMVNLTLEQAAYLSGTGLSIDRLVGCLLDEAMTPFSLLGAWFNGDMTEAAVLEAIRISLGRMEPIETPRRPEQEEAPYESQTIEDFMKYWGDKDDQTA